MRRYDFCECLGRRGCWGLSQLCLCAEFSARLTGFNETPAILSDGSGTFSLKLDRKASTATY
jgi:hypothetical protein